MMPKCEYDMAKASFASSDLGVTVREPKMLSKGHDTA